MWWHRFRNTVTTGQQQTTSQHWYLYWKTCCSFIFFQQDLTIEGKELDIPVSAGVLSWKHKLVCVSNQGNLRWETRYTEKHVTRAKCKSEDREAIQPLASVENCSLRTLGLRGQLTSWCYWSWGYPVEARATEILPTRRWSHGWSAKGDRHWLLISS